MEFWLGVPLIVQRYLPLSSRQALAAADVSDGKKKTNGISISGRLEEKHTLSPRVLDGVCFVKGYSIERDGKYPE